MFASALRRLPPAPAPRPDLLFAAMREGAAVFDLALPPAAADAARVACLGLLRALSAHARRTLRVGQDAAPATPDETAIVTLVVVIETHPDLAERLVEWLVVRPGQPIVLIEAMRLAHALRCG